MNRKPEILIIDDDKAIVDSLSALFRDNGYSPSGVYGGNAALECVKNALFDLIILDLGVPDIDGLELLKKLKELNISSHIIIITGQGTIGKAVEATKLGAFNMIEKPLDPEKLLLDCQIAIKQRFLEHEVAQLRHSLLSQNDLIGKSDVIQSLREKLRRVASSDSRVFFWGEPGVGKEMAARYLHFSSPRATGPFVAINCAAILGELFESELFGYDKEASTGATAAMKGKFELADSGTLFLDEVAELRPDHQAKLLRAIESSSIQRLGASTETIIDIRIVSASNKDIKLEMQEGRFLEDLYFRLNVIPVFVPPLREHIDDIPLLARHFLDILGYSNLRLDASALATLSSYDWPGNVRELKNIIERSAAICCRDTIAGPDVKEAISGIFGGVDQPNIPLISTQLNLRDHTNRYEKLLLEQMLAENDGNITRVAKILKMDRGNLSKKLKKYGLTGKE